MSTMALEVAALPEYEFEDEYEMEWEDESEEFFRQLAGLARRAASSPRLRRAARVAARAVAPGLGDVGAALGGAPRSTGALAGGAAGAALGRVLADLYPRTGDPEWEFELMGEFEANPIRRVYPDAVMEHLAHRAAETGSEAEAEALIGALFPLAARLVPRAAPAVARAMPQLAQGIARAARALRATPSTQPLVRVLPHVARGTVASLARQSARGAPVGPQRALTTLAQQAARTLSSPQQSARAYQRNRSLDRVYHRQLQGLRAAGPGAGRLPAGTPYRALGR